MNSATGRFTTEKKILIGDGFVPIIDISPARSGIPEDRLNVAKIIDQTCRESGFLVLSGHEVDEKIISRILHESQLFFQLPSAVKEQVRCDPADLFTRGYTRTGRLEASNDDAHAVTASRSAPDAMERFIYNPMGDPDAQKHIDWVPHPACSQQVPWLPNKWPASESFRRAFLDYYQEVSQLARELMRLFALALSLPENWFDPVTSQPVAHLAVNHYPAQHTPPPEGQLRLGKHSDWGSFTILYQDDSISGLQVLDSSGQWCDVPAIPGTFVINIGDMMKMWTNNRWVSTVHRVQNPPAQHALTERLSLPFFCQPNHSTLIECIPTCQDADHPSLYQPVRAGHYLLEKYIRAYG